MVCVTCYVVRLHKLLARQKNKQNTQTEAPWEGCCCGGVASRNRVSGSIVAAWRHLPRSVLESYEVFSPESCRRRRRRRRRCRVDVAAPLLTRRCDLYSVTARLDAPRASVPSLVDARPTETASCDRLRASELQRAIRSSGLERTPVHTATLRPTLARIDSSNAAKEAP